MWGWLREFQEIRHANEERRLRLRQEQEFAETQCHSCEVLKIELAKERSEKQRLMDHILKPAEVIPERTEAPELQVPLRERHMPWKVRQQLLEEDDRKKASIIKKFEEVNANLKVDTSKITPATSIDELERTLGVVKGDG